MIKSQRTLRTSTFALWAAIAAALLAGAAAAPDPHGIRPRTSPSCSSYYYQNFTEPAMGTPACRVTVDNQCYYTSSYDTCAYGSWYCPEGCGDPANRRPMTCQSYANDTRVTCGIATNSLTTSSWSANMTVGEDAGKCFFKAADGVYRGPPYSRSYDFSLRCNSTAPCRWDSLNALRKGSSKAGPSSWVLAATHLIANPNDGSASVSGKQACRAAMACPAFGGLFSSGPEVDYGGTYFACIPNDDAFMEGLLVKRDSFGRAACLTDGSGSCMVLPGSCCSVLGRNQSWAVTAAADRGPPTSWPTVPCPAGAAWCPRALAATTGMTSFNAMLGHNCTFTPVRTNQNENYTQSEPDPSAGPWTVVRRTPSTYDSEYSKRTYTYRILRRTGNGSIACAGSKTYSARCFDDYNYPSITDPACAANLARTVPADIFWKILDRSDKAYNDTEILYRLGMDPARPLPGGTPPDPPIPTPRGAWKCVQLCGENGDRVLARYHGTGGGVQCRGSDAGRCSFYRDSACTSLAPGEPEPHPSGEVGYVCSVDDQMTGWCARAAAAVLPWGTGVSDCAPQEIRAPCNGACSPSASCVRYGGSSFCLCNDGFFGDGLTCTADPCVNNNGGCSPQATCAPSASGPVCTCWEGYLGDGRNCLPDPCFNNGGCTEYALCVRTGPSSRTCKCRPDYPVCDAHAKCAINSIHGYPECVCVGGYESGYTLDGHYYQCRSKCLTRPNGGCSANATCSIRPDGTAVVCTCKAAFYGNGKSCRAKGAVRLSVSAPASARRGRRVAISARALNSAGKPVSKLVIQFQVGSGAKVNGTTNAAGTASANYLVPARAALGRTTVTARFLGTTTLLQATARKTLTVVR